MSRKSNHQNNHVKSFKINDNNNRHRLGQNISFDDEFERQLNDVRNHRNQSFDSDHDNGHDIRYDADDQQMNTQQIIKRFILAFNGQLNQFNDKLKLFADQLQILSDSVNTIQLQSQYLTTNFQTFTSQCMNVLLLSSPSSTTTTSSSAAAAAATVSSSLMKLLQDSTIYLEDDLTNLSNTNQFVDSESESDHHHHHRNHNQKTNVSNKRISGNTNHNKFNSTTINRSTSIEQIRNEPSTSAIQDDYHNRDYRFVDSDDDDDDGHDDQRMVNTGGTGKQSQNNPNRMNQRSNQRKFFRNHRCLNTTNDLADDGDQSIDDPFEFPVMTKQKRNQSRTTTNKSTTSKPNTAGNSTKSLTTTAKQSNAKTLTKTSNKKNQNKKR